MPQRGGPSVPPRSLTPVAARMRRAGLIEAVVREPDRAVRADRGLSRLALGAGAIFVVAGLVKFVFHHWELHAFRDFGLPWPAVLEIFAGVLETLGGMLLMARRLIVPVALLLAVTMIVATYSSGIVHDDVIPSLTLAPALLLAMLYLLVRALVIQPAAPRSARAH